MKAAVANAWGMILDEQYQALMRAILEPKRIDVGAQRHVFNCIVDMIQDEHQKEEAERVAKAAARPKRKKKKSKKKARRGSKKKPTPAPTPVSMAEHSAVNPLGVARREETVDPSSVDGGELPAG